MNDDNNVLDRSIYEDSLLFHLNADLGRANDTEVRVMMIIGHMLEELPYAAHKKHPDLLVHIRVSFETMLDGSINGDGNTNIFFYPLILPCTTIIKN